MLPRDIVMLRSAVQIVFLGWYAVPIALVPATAAPPTIRLHAEASQTHEASGFARGGRVAVVRDGDLSQPLDVPVQIGGTATAGQDYLPLTPTFRFAPGQRLVRVEVAPIDDDVLEGPETVTFGLSPSPAYQLGPTSTQSATVTIAGEIPQELRSNALVIGPSDSTPQWVGDVKVSPIELSDISLPFSTAEEAVVGNHVNIWDAGPMWNLPSTIGEQEQVLVWFFAKGTPLDPEMPTAKLTVRLQKNSGAYDGAEQTFDLARQWKPYLFRATMPADLPAGQSSLSLRLGHGRQRVAIAGCHLWNFGRSPTPHLPEPIFSYDGRDADAPWRAQLKRENIKEVYEIGTAVNPRWISTSSGNRSSTKDAETYRSIVLKYFDRITDENGQQWISWLTNPQPAKDLADWAVANDRKLRGHSVMWGDPIKWPSPPDLWENYQSTVQTRGDEAGVLYLRKRVAEHVRNDSLVALNGTIPGTNQPVIAEWDVVNHPILHGEMWDITGWEFLRAAIRDARTLAHPETEFFINEDRVLAGPTHENATPLAQVIDEMRKHQVPIDGIGFQCHFKSHQLPTIDGIKRTLDRFAAFEMALHVTEFDIDDRFIDEQTQADFTRDFLDLCAAHPAVTAMIAWGFWEGEHWRSEEGAAMWTKGWKLRPNGQVFIDHVEQVRRQR